MVMKEIKRFGVPEARNDCKTLGKATATALQNCRRDMDLGLFFQCHCTSEWLTDGVDGMASDHCLKSVKVRVAVLQTVKTKIHIIESLGHIVQRGRNADGPRYVRHNSLAEMLARKLNVMWFITRIEPRIPTIEGTLPDLCAWKDTTYIVCDVAMESDTDDDLDKKKFIFLRCQNMTCRESTNR